MDRKGKDIVIAFTTAPAQEAEKLARSLVESALAACVQEVSQVRSHYIWQGKLEQVTETLLIIKTTREQIEAAKNFIETNHSYEVPEFLVVPVSDGLDSYLNWISGRISGEEIS